MSQTGQIPPVTPSAAPSTVDPTTAAAVASTQGSQQLSSTSTISSMADLKKKAPQVYQMMMQGIAMNICDEMKRHQDTLKSMMDEANRNN